MATPVVIPLVDEGLGNSAYLVNLGDGRGLVVDAARVLRLAAIDQVPVVDDEGRPVGLLDVQDLLAAKML